MKENRLINELLVKDLVQSQFPQWKHLPISPVAQSGWDNRSFCLGESMLVRMPSAEHYVPQVEKEQQWLPKLAKLLPLPIPEPIALGQPEFGYPWKWSIYRWIDGEPASIAQINDMNQFAISVADFLVALEKIDATNAPRPGKHCFYRGGDLKVYDAEIRQAIGILKDRLDEKAILRIWEAALATKWQHAPVWVHGDMSPGNLLVRDGKLCAVIDFGQLTSGDPACDLAIAWTMFSRESRQTFHNRLQIDNETWLRGCAWVLWKALIVIAELHGTNPREIESSKRILGEIMSGASW